MDMMTDTANKIVEYIRAHKKVRPNELINFLKISEVAVHKQLKKLVQNGTLQKNGSSPLTVYVLALKPEDVKKIISPILKKHGIRKASIFGSYARGDYNADSDVDILIEAPKLFSLFDLVDLEQKMENKINKDIDLVEYQTIKPAIKESVLRYQIPVI